MPFDSSGAALVVTLKASTATFGEKKTILNLEDLQRASAELASKHSWANHFIAVDNGVVSDFSVLRDGDVVTVHEGVPDT